MQLGDESQDITPMRTKDVQALFQGLGPAAIQLQCGDSGPFFVCHVKPGTRLAVKGFTSNTGYFTTIPDSGLVEMVRKGR